MENEPNTENVHYMDEYPEIQKRLWFKRLAAQRELGQLALFPEDPGQLILFPTEYTGDQGA